MLADTFCINTTSISSIKNQIINLMYALTVGFWFFCINTCKELDWWGKTPAKDREIKWWRHGAVLCWR